MPLSLVVENHRIGYNSTTKIDRSKFFQKKYENITQVRLELPGGCRLSVGCRTVEGGRSIDCRLKKTRQSIEQYHVMMHLESPGKVKNKSNIVFFGYFAL